MGQFVQKNGITQVQQFWNTWLFWLSTYFTEHRFSISTRTLNNIYQLSITRYPKLQVDSNIHKISVVQWKNSNSKHQLCIEKCTYTFLQIFQCSLKLLWTHLKFLALSFSFTWHSWNKFQVTSHTSTCLVWPKFWTILQSGDYFW